MAGELRMKQIIDEEVKPAIRKTLPDILERLAWLEARVNNLEITDEAPVSKVKAKTEMPQKPKAKPKAKTTKRPPAKK